MNEEVKRRGVCEANLESVKSTSQPWLENAFETYVNVHAAFVGAWQQSVFWSNPAFCTAQRVSYVQRKSRPHLNRLTGSNSQPDPAEGQVGRSCAGNVTA